MTGGPSNPAGTVLAATEMKALCDYCAARCIRLVSDEIYHGITYTSVAAATAEGIQRVAAAIRAAVDANGIVYVCNPGFGNNVIERRGPGNTNLGSITATVNGVPVAVGQRLTAVASDPTEITQLDWSPE